MSAMSCCWMLNPGCHRTAKVLTREEMRNDWYNDSLLSRSGTGTSTRCVLEAVAGFQMAAVLINLRGAGAEDREQLVAFTSQCVWLRMGSIKVNNPLF